MYKKLTPKEFKELWKESKDTAKARLIDARPLSHYTEEHLADAESFPCDELENNLDSLRDPEKIFVYCNTGISSARACDALKNLPIEVYDLDGGIVAWSEAGFETEQKE